MISIPPTPSTFSIRNDLYTPPLLDSPPPVPSYTVPAGTPPRFTTESNNDSKNDENEPSGHYLLWSQWEDSDSDGGSQVIKRARLDSSDNILTQIIPDTPLQ